MKKVLSVLLATATAVSVCGGLAACGGDDGKTITVWAPTAAVASYKKYINEGFKTAYPAYKDYKIKVVAMEEDVVQDKLGNGASVSSGANVFFFPSDHLNAVKKKGALQALTDEYVDIVMDRDEQKVIDGATRNEKIYAFPATYDNGYILYYDKTFYTDPSEVLLLDDMQAKARSEGKTILFNVGSGYYASSMFWAAGVEFGYTDEEGLKGYTVSKLTGDEGKAVGLACYKYFNPSTSANGDGEEATVIIDGNVNTDIGAGFADGSMVAGIGGSWAWSNIKEQMALNDRDAEEEIGITILPKFKYTLGGQEIQKNMYSFIGYKYCGVNASKPKDQIKVSLALAEYLTKEEGQYVRYKATNSCPSNKNLTASEEIQNDPIFQAFHRQEEFGVPHNAHPSAFWSPTFITDIMNGTTTQGKVVAALKTWYDALIA